MPGIRWTSSFDHSGFVDGMKEIQRSLAETNAKIEQAGGNIESMFRRIAGLAGVSLSVDGIKNFVSHVAQTRAYFQDIESSMKVFLGNEKKASEFTNKLKDYAYYNMFEFSQLADASKQMIAYGHSVDTIIPRLDQLSNVARGTNAPLMEMVGAYNRAKNLGGLGARDLQAWAAKGLVIKDILKDMGETVDSNTVSFEQLNKVLDHVTGEGGMFHNLMGEQMSNISAEQGQLQDTLDAMYNEIGEKYQDTIVNWYKMNTEIVDGFVDSTSTIMDAAASSADFLIAHYQEIGSVMLRLIAVYGEWKATLIAANAIRGAKQNFLKEEEIMLLNKAIEDEKRGYEELLDAKEKAKNADLADAVAKRKLTEEQAALIAAKREELSEIKVNKESLSVDQQINELKLQKLDIDLQDKVASEQLTLAQAQEVQQRREVLASLEQEVAKRRELEIAKAQGTINRNEATVGEVNRAISNNKGQMQVYEDELDNIDKQISLLEVKGGKENEINALKQQRNSIIENEIKLGDTINAQEERVRALNQENELMEQRILDIKMRYGTREERANEINAAADALKAELVLVQRESAEKQSQYEQMVRVRTAEEQRLIQLQTELEKVREINRERAKGGEQLIDTSSMEKAVADQQAYVDTLNDASHMKEENALATAAQETAEKAQNLQTQINTLSEQANSVATGTNTKAKAGNATATQALTVSERIHNASLAASTLATRVFTVAVNQVKTAIKGLGAAIMTNPIGVLVGALTIALPWIMEWIGGTEEATASEEKYGKAAREAEQDVKALVDVVENTVSSSKAHKDAMNELIRTYEEYGIKLDENIMKGNDEKAKTDEVKAKHEQLIAVLRQEAIERQKANDISDASKEYGDAYEAAKKNMLRNLPDEMTSAAGGQLVGMIDETAIRKFIELRKEIKAAMDEERQAAEQGKRATDYTKILQENEARIQSLTQRYTDYAKALGLEDSQVSQVRKTVVDYISDLAKATEEQDKAKEAAIVAAEKAENLSDSQSELARRVRYAKMSTSELRDELQRLPTNIPIDITLTYNETNPMPEVLKNYTSKQWKARANAFANMAAKHRKGAKVYDSETKTTRYWSSEELINEAVRASNQSDTVKSREDAAADAARRRREEAEKNADKNRRAAEREASERTARRKKLAELGQKEAEERVAQARRTEEAVASARIAAITNAGERERMEMENQRNQDLQRVSELEESYRKKNLDMIKARWEATNTDKNKLWTDSAEYKQYAASPESVRLTNDQQAEIDARRAEAEAKYQQLVQKRYNEELQASYEFLQKYGDYEQQKFAITKEYEDKISKASTTTEKAALSIERDKQLKELEKSQLEDSIDWSGVFNDMSGHTKEYLEDLRDQLQKLLSTGNLPIDQMETIQEKVRDINEAINEQGGMFNYANEQQREHTRRVQEAKDAQDRLNAALLEQKGIEADIAISERAIRDMLKDIDPKLADINLDEGFLDALGLDKNSEQYKELEKIVLRLRTAEGKLGEARKNTAKRTFEWKKAEDSANESLKDGIARVAGNIKDWVNKFLGDLPDLLNEIGLGGIGEKVSQGISAVNNAAGAAADFASGNYVGAALKAVSAVKDFGRVFGIGGGNAAEINKQLARLSDRNEILTQSIDKLTDAMNGKGGAGAIKEYMKVAEMQKELEENLVKQMQLQMRYSSSHGSFNKYWGSGFSSSEIAEFNKRHGTNWSGDLNDLNADLAALLMGEADMWQKINDTGKGGYGERVAEKIKELAEQAGKAKEQTDALYASLTAGTTRDSVFDDFLGSLYDLADGSEDVMENIEKNWQTMVNHMVINNLVGEKLRERLSGWYNQLAELNKERTKEGSTMSDAEYKKKLDGLYEIYQSYLKEGTDEIEQFREMGIIKNVQEATEEAKEYFEDLRNSWASALTDMTSTAEDWKQQLLADVFSDLVESTILDAPLDVMIGGAQKHFDDFDAYLKDWQERYKTVIEDTTVTDEERNARLKSLIDEQTSLREEQAEKSKALAEGIGYEIKNELSNSLDNLGDTLLSSLLDTSDDAADMGKEIASTLIKEMLQTMLASEQYATQIKAIKEKWQNVLSGKNTDEMGNVLFTMDDVLQDITSLNTAIANDEGIKALADQYKALNEEVAKTDTTFKDMGGEFESALMSLDGTAEDWAASVGQKMAQKIIEQMVSSTMIQPYLDDLQSAFDNAMSVEGTTIDGVLAQLAPQIDAAKAAFNEAQPVAQRILASLGITRKLELPFSDLRGTFVSTLTDMEADAKSFGKDITKTLIEQMIDKRLKDEFQGKLDELNNAWAEALQNGDSAAIERIRQQMVELRGDAAEAVKPLLEDLKALDEVVIDTPLHNLRSSFLSDLMNMEDSTEDFANNINKILTEAFVDKFVLGDAFEEELAKWEERYAAIMEADTTEEERSRQLQDLQNSITVARDKYTEQANAIKDLMGYGTEATSPDQEAHVNMADKATYDQFELYLGIATAQQIALEQGNDVRNQILATLQAMSGITSPNGDTVKEIRSMLHTTNEHLYAIKIAAEGIRVECLQRLQSIDNKLTKL